MQLKCSKRGPSIVSVRALHASVASSSLQGHHSRCARFRAKLASASHCDAAPITSWLHSTSRRFNERPLCVIRACTSVERKSSEWSVSSESAGKDVTKSCNWSTFEKVQREMSSVVSERYSDPQQTARLCAQLQSTCSRDTLDRLFRRVVQWSRTRWAHGCSWSFSHPMRASVRSVSRNWGSHTQTRSSRVIARYPITLGETGCSTRSLNESHWRRWWRDMVE